MCLFVLTNTENMVFFLFPCTSHRLLFMNDISLNYVCFFSVLSLKDKWICTMELYNNCLRSGAKC